MWTSFFNIATYSYCNYLPYLLAEQGTWATGAGTISPLYQTLIIPDAFSNFSIDSGMLAVWHSVLPPLTSTKLKAVQFSLCVRQAVEQVSMLQGFEIPWLINTYKMNNNSIYLDVKAPEFGQIVTGSCHMLGLIQAALKSPCLVFKLETCTRTAKNESLSNIFLSILADYCWPVHGLSMTVFFLLNFS